MINIPQNAREIVAKVTREAALRAGEMFKEQRLKHGEELPLEVYGVTIPNDGFRTFRVSLLPAPGGFLPSEQRRAFMRRLAETQGGVAVFAVTEAWYANVQAPEGTTLENCDQTSIGPVKDLPGAREVILVAISAPHLNEAWVADIRSPSDIGEFVSQADHCDVVAGNYVDILPAAQDD